MHNDIAKTYGRLVILLEDWADWQRGYSGIKGYASHTPGCHSGYVSKSFDDLIDEVHNDVCRLVGYAVDDLPAGQQAAINKRYGIAAVFRFPRGNYEQLLLEAHQTLMMTLPKKGVVV